MSAETLRKAANLMRETHRHDATREADTFVAVADWLEATARKYESYLDTFAPGSRAGAATSAANTQGLTEALTVARTYLGESA